MRNAPTPLLAAAAALAALTARGSRAEETGACAAWEIEYTLAAKVELSDTLMGAGDGVHTIGPGTLVVRFEDHQGAPAGRAQLVSYQMRDEFTVESSTLFWNTKVENRTRTLATPDACGVVAHGDFDGKSLRWTSPIHGMHTDGQVTCSGLFCGKFGAPPEGTTAVHTRPQEVSFEPFVYNPDQHTFSMAWSIVSKMETPRQTSRIALIGSEAHRSCVAVPPCR